MIKTIYKKLVSERFRIRVRLFQQQLIAPFYAGKGYFCNCCGKTARKFRPMGHKKRENAKCPFCLSLERTRLLKAYLTTEIGLYKREHIRLLHFAPEISLFKELSKLNIEYIDGDINPNNARTVIDITGIQFPDNYFDLIICSHVLGHVYDEPKAISEMRRVLKPGGVALVLTLLDASREKTYENTAIHLPAERLAHYGEIDLCRLHGADFSNRLEQEGFCVTAIDYRKTFTDEENRRFGFGDGEREMIFSCRK